MAAPEHQASVPDNILVHKAAYLQCTPSMASMLVADAAGRTALSQLRALLVGGEAMPLSLARDLRAIVPGKLMNMYGPTETTIWSSTHDLSAVSDFVPLGDPIANTTFHVLTRDGRECPNFVPGELYIGGDGVTVGYHNRPELTAERFVPNPFSGRGRLYRTGDLVRRHSSGELEFLGRIDHQVKIRGHRIELGEIEAALGQQKGVKDCAVVAREDGLGDKRLVAYVTAVAGLTLDVAKIREELAGELPDVMVPATIVELPAMPLTPNGKLDRKALPEPRAANSEDGPARSDLENIIAGIWCKLLGLSSVGTSDNFFDLGGHSLLIVQVQRQLKQTLGREVAIVDMFRLPNDRGTGAVPEVGC